MATFGPISTPGSGVTYSAAARSAAVCSIIGAAIHLWVLPSHAREWWVLGAFFAAAVAAQLFTALMVLRRPHPRFVTVGIVTNLTIALVWLVSRTSGLPFGPPVLDMTAGLADPARGGYGDHVVGTPEAVGLLDTLATAFGLLTVCALLALLPEKSRRRATNLVLFAGLLLWGGYLLSAFTSQ